ncbi:protein msta isoform X2 [Eurytemora carolleeae]|uniref:protein msta isoform X2 n=1 Tax=Eurytemora carolleeae TaxID=1294199 RepID=UPI000C759126|nr:protein msta isoform X2 [Eurytemora carolleeae]|eukprot:XP_023348143.1 protein msta-like isoform X2 [Eurytemora affinis]
MGSYSYCASSKQLVSWYSGSTNLELDANLEPTAADHGDVLYNIGKSETVGRFMVAARDISPGEVIFTDQPAVIGPDNSALPMCLVCWRKIMSYYTCPGCGWPLCGEKCRDTKSHQRECSFFQERGKKVEISGFGKPNRIYDAVLPLRILLLKLSDPRVYRLVCLLMDHHEDQSNSQKKRFQVISDLIRNSWGFNRDFSNSEVKHVLGILSVNSFVVHDGAEDGMDLIGLYPWTSLMSHACIPNVKIITRDDFSYVCEATVPIAAGSEIVTSYHHYYFHLFGTMYRRLDIKKTWSFDCICQRCQDKTESGTFVSGVNCDACKYSYLLPTQPLQYNSDWSCLDCNHTLPGQVISERLDKLELEIESVPKNEPERLENLLRRMRYVLHENHYLITDTKRKLIDIYGHKPGFELEKLSKEILEKKIDYCDHLLSLASRLSPGQSEMKGYLLWERHGCTLRLAQWDWIRMKCTTIQYVNSLQAVCASLREIISILGPIRVDSVEGGNGVKVGEEDDLYLHLHFEGRKGEKPFAVQCSAKHALEEIEKQLETLEKQTLYRDTAITLRQSRTETRFNRRSIAL